VIFLQNEHYKKKLKKLENFESKSNSNGYIFQF
jgi:hypothetical protein